MMHITEGKQKNIVNENQNNIIVRLSHFIQILQHPPRSGDILQSIVDSYKYKCIFIEIIEISTK